MTTQAQKIHLNAELWPAACRQQGWKPKDREKLYEIYARVLGEREPHMSKLAEGGRISACDFVSAPGRDDFGDVKKELQLLAGNDLLQADPIRRQRLWKIRSRLMPCYRVYRPDAALETILRDRFKRVRLVNGIDDLGSADLEKLIWTLEARVNVCRNDAGETHHQMCDKARVKPWRCPAKCERCAQVYRNNLSGKSAEAVAEYFSQVEPDPEYAPPVNSDQEAF